MTVAKKTRRRWYERYRMRTQPGAPPGLIVTDPEAHPTEVHVLEYGPDAIDERSAETVEEATAGVGTGPVVWIDVIGLSDQQVITDLGAALNLHPLALEDVVHVGQRPKMEEYADHVFVVGRFFTYDEELESEELSLFFGDGFVVTFQERPGDCFEPVRQRLRGGRGRIRGAGADYLAYALLDAIVDHYFPVFEAYGDHLEVLEERVLAGAEPTIVNKLMGVRRDLVRLRRAAWPMRDALSALLREGVPNVQKETRVFLRDCHDHAIRLVDLAENFRELASSLMEVHLSVQGQRLNEVMKVLTIIATLFIPLGFIAGLYGMNFDPDVSPFNMPELGWRYGYPFALGLMAAVVVLLMLYFKNKRWIGRGSV